ncbi:MAG TPA: glycosyltransferase [Candidatus Babeliales bacterium]|nr:glycosyltransferase [Candidatus Babeliales bacterium]
MKKIVIFTSSGGGGQISVTKALAEHLSGAYQIVPSYIFASVLGSIDLIQTLTFGKYTGEDLYNHLLAKQSLKIFNGLFYKLGSMYYGFYHKRTKRLLKVYLEEEKPDLVISVIPYANQGILEATQELGIPFLLFTADLDPFIYLHNMEYCDDKLFKLAVPFSDPVLLSHVEKYAVSQDNVVVTGYPVHPAFTQKKDSAAIKKELQIPADKPVVFVLLGALGSPSQYTFAQELASISYPVHIIFGVGKNHEMKQKIEDIAYPEHITKMVIGFTDRVADIMAISDILLTKSGSVSFCEGLYMNVPMLLDATADTVIQWEKENHVLVERLEFGVSIKNYKQAVDMITYWLANPEELQKVKQRIMNFEKKDGLIGLQQMVGRLLETSVVVQARTFQEYRIASKLNLLD